MQCDAMPRGQKNDAAKHTKLFGAGEKESVPYTPYGLGMVPT
jgi:azurin